MQALPKTVFCLSPLPSRTRKRSVLFLLEGQINMRRKNIIMGIVSYTLETAPSVDREELNRLAAMKDEDIDYSDIPPLDTLSLRTRPTVDRGMYRPVKVAITCELDTDIADWLNQSGESARLNSILRRVMDSAQSTASL